jgi:hypothetical protein
MTDEILQADIDLARRLIDGGTGDEEIIGLLARRNIAPNRAARLVSELRSGCAVEPDRVWRGVAREPARSLTSSAVSAAKPQRRRTPTRPTIPWFRILVASGVCLCIGLAAWANHQRNLRQQEDAKRRAPAMGVTAETSQRLDPASVILEVDDHGVRLGSEEVGPENAIQVFTSLFGEASRTNDVATLGKLVYVFDLHGLLIYPAKDHSPNSIMIDFEGAGGTNSAARPFGGTVKIAGSTINGATDPQTLPIIEKLGASTNAGNSGIYNLQLKGVRVVLASLSRPDRLSLIEIDFEESWGKARR